MLARTGRSAWYCNCVGPVPAVDSRGRHVHFPPCAPISGRALSGPNPAASLDLGFGSPPVVQPAPYGAKETAGALIAAGWRFRGGKPDVAVRAGPPLEAKACGAPVLAGRTGSFPQTGINGQTGLLFETGNTTAPARTLATLVDVDGLHAANCARERDRVTANFALEPEAKALAQLHHQLCEVDVGR